MSTSIKTGWQGGLISSSTYDSLSDKGKSNYDNYVEKTGGPLNNAQKENKSSTTTSSSSGSSSSNNNKNSRPRGIIDVGQKDDDPYGFDEEDYNTGGLASKPKPKPKKMRSGGLASKK